jgi:hypothetical protein
LRNSFGRSFRSFLASVLAYHHPASDAFARRFIYCCVVDELELHFVAVISIVGH